MDKKLLIALFPILSMFSCGEKKVSVISYYPIGENAWQIESMTNENKEFTLVYSTYEGVISAYIPEKKNHLWKFDAGAFIFSLKTADIDQDGIEEIMAVTAEGDLVVLDSGGKLLWKFKDIHSLFTIDVGDFDPEEKGLEIAAGGISRKVFVFNKEGKEIYTIRDMERLVFRIILLDLDHDGLEEILAIENRTIAHAIDLNEGQVRTLWRKPLTVPEDYINWENPRGRFYPFSLASADLDSDGSLEIIGGDVFFNKQAVLVADLKGDPVWISDNLPPFENRRGSQTEFYSTAFVGVSDFNKSMPGQEVLAVSGGNFRIFSNKGDLLGEADSQIGFTDFITRGNEVYLSSSPNGDNYIYKIIIDEDWENTIRQIERMGLVKEVEKNIGILKDQVLNYKDTLDLNRKYWINLSFEHLETTDQGLKNNLRIRNWFKERFPYSNIELMNSIKVIEPTPPLDENGNPWFEYRWSVDAINGTMTVDEIIEKARWIEENKIPTLFNIGHSCMPFITLETAEKILETAPDYCIGFQTSEDEMLDLIPRYFKYYFGPLADLCVKHGYKLAITKNKGLWWLSSPAHKEVYEALFEGERRKVVVAATEDSNSRTPELNLLARGGLWQAGVLQNNEVSIHMDLFSFNRFFQWEYPKTGSPFLRLMVAHTTLGMTQFNARIKEIFNRDDDYLFNLAGRESTEIYYHMLGRNIVFSPEPEEVLGYNPTGIVVHKPSEEWLVDAHNGHSPEKWEGSLELHNAIIPHNGCPWGMTNTPSHALQKVLLGKSRQFGYQIPATPYGLIAFVSEHADLDQVTGIQEWWHTDGIYIWKDENSQKLTGESAAVALRDSFDEGARKIPFRLEGYAFLNVHKIRNGHYRLYVIDPGYIDPDPRDVIIKIQIQGEYEAKDILSKKNVDIIDNSIQMHIPAGTLRIIDVIADSMALYNGS